MVEKAQARQKSKRLKIHFRYLISEVRVRILRLVTFLIDILEQCLIICLNLIEHYIDRVLLRFNPMRIRKCNQKPLLRTKEFHEDTQHVNEIHVYQTVLQFRHQSSSNSTDFSKILSSQTKK